MGQPAGPTSDGHLVGPHNDAGQVAFRTTRGDLLLFNASSGFHRALDNGSPVPGTAQSVFDTIEPLDMNDTQVLFSGTFSLSQSGLFLLDTQTGVVQKVVARNEVAPGAPLSLTHVFPQFADGSYEDGSIKTAFLLVNSTSFENVVSLNFRTSDGSAANVSIGGETADHFSFSLAPKGSALVQTQAIGPIQNGYVLLESEGEMAASEIFAVFDAEGNRVTEAGVLPSLPGRHFTLGVEAQNDVNTGVALVNLSGEEADLVFIARDQAGNIVASIEQTLGPNEHLAEYVAGELFTDLETLVGSVEVVSSVEVHKLTLRSGAHSLTTLRIAD